MNGDSSPDSDVHHAAGLAFALLRLAGGAAHPDVAAPPRGVPRVGSECYRFAPSSQAVMIADVPLFLTTLPSPAILIPTTTRGVVSLMLLDELSGHRRASAEAAFRLQCANLKRRIDKLQLRDDSVVLLQFDDEERLFPLSALSIQRRRFLVAVPSQLEPYTDDSRANARLTAVRSDGAWSWGLICPIDYPGEDQSTNNG